MWRVLFLGDEVVNEFEKLPPKIKSKMLKIIDLLKEYGNGVVGEPYTKSLGGGLFEIRAKGMEGIGRGIYCYEIDKTILILNVFVKKTQKTPKKEIELALKRLKEYKDGKISWV